MVVAVKSPIEPSTRERLIAAARREFAERGFDGASTRRIAEQAGSHQPQINYFFGSKTDLWHAVVHDLYVDLRTATADIDTLAPPGDVLADVIRSFVRFAHRRPELHQILIHEFTAASERLDWVVDTFTGPAFVDFHRLWTAATESGVAASIDRRVAFHVFVGAASLLPVAAAEARRQLHDEADDADIVHVHGDALVTLLLPGVAAKHSTSLPDPTADAVTPKGR